MLSRDDVRSFLAERIAKAMYMQVDELDDNQLFSDFGLESVTLARILVDVRERYACEVTVGDLLKHQTLGEAAGLVHARIASVSAERGGSQ